MYEIALKGSKLSLVALFDLKLHILTFNFFAEFRSGLSYCTANGAQPYVGKSWKSISRVRKKNPHDTIFFLARKMLFRRFTLPCTDSFMVPNCYRIVCD